MLAIGFHFGPNKATMHRPAMVVEHQGRPNHIGSYGDHDMAKRPLPSPEELRQLLSYDAETGKLFWLPRPREIFATSRAFALWNTRFAGHEAFTSVNNNGYRHGKVFGIGLLASRVIWALQTGAWPTEYIDHRDTDRLNNKWCNLRSATHAENMHNQGRRRSTSGLKGVHWDSRDQKWRAQIMRDGKKHFLGNFTTAEAAHEAYKIAAGRLHGEFARVS